MRFGLTWGALAGALVTGLATMTAVELVVAEDTPPVPVTIEGSGASEIASELTDWQDAMATAEQPVDLQYYQRGSTDGRRQLLDGLTSFAVSGRPFTADELASRPAGAGEIISVPLEVASLSIVATTPSRTGWATTSLVPGCDPNDPDVPDPEACYVRGTFTGPFRVPAENLSALIVGLSPSFQGNQLATWAQADWASALGTTSLDIQRASLKHTFVNRTEGSGANYALMDYASTLGPRAWDLRKQENPEFAWEPIGEVFSPRVLSRYGADTQLGIIAVYRVDAATNSTPDTWTGNMGAISTTSVEQMQADYPAAQMVEFEIQNANGDWVTATTESISAALAADDTAVNVAAHEKIPGAYPLVWVNRLYVAAGSLTPEQANALAATVRYIVTDGQQAVVDHGGAALTESLRAEAIAAADRIVTENCTAEGYEVTQGGAGGYEPDTPGVAAIGTMRHCTLIPVATTTSTTTTTTVATTYSTVSSYTPYVPSDPYVPDAGGDTTTETTTADAGTTTTSTTIVASEAVTPSTVPRGKALDDLPMAAPTGERGQLSRPLGTMMLGAGGFLGGRRVFHRRRTRA